METTFKVLTHEVYFDVLVNMKLENGESLTAYVSDIDDAILGDYEFVVSNDKSTYLVTLNICESKLFLIDKLLFIKLS